MPATRSEIKTSHMAFVNPLRQAPVGGTLERPGIPHSSEIVAAVDFIDGPERPARWIATNVGTPEEFFLYKVVESDQAKTHEGDCCRRPSCSHDRNRHREGTGSCEFALVGQMLGVCPRLDPYRSRVGMRATCELGRRVPRGTGLRGFEPRLKAPEASVLSKLDYRPAPRRKGSWH